MPLAHLILLQAFRVNLIILSFWAWTLRCRPIKGVTQSHMASKSGTGFKLSPRTHTHLPFLHNFDWSQVSCLLRCSDGSISSTHVDHLQLHGDVVQRPSPCTLHLSLPDQAAAGAHCVPGSDWVKRIRRWVNLIPALWSPQERVGCGMCVHVITDTPVRLTLA